MTLDAGGDRRRRARTLPRLRLEPSLSFDITETPESLNMVSVKFRRRREKGVRPFAIALDCLRRVSTDEILLKRVPHHFSLNFATDRKSEQVTKGRKDIVDVGKWDLVSSSDPWAANNENALGSPPVRSAVVSPSMVGYHQEEILLAY